MWVELERAYDEGRFGIVPVDKGDRSLLEFRVLALDPRLCEREPECHGIPFDYMKTFAPQTAEEVEEHATLKWRHPMNRPRMKYLYLTCMMSLFRRERYGCSDWIPDYQELGR